MNRSVRARRAGLTAALSISLAWIGLASRPVSAQLGVQITAPAAGSTVGGSIAVTASVNDPLGTTQGVQFQLDGVNLGAEDTTAPYAITWDTRTASNASHVLRAVARSPLGVGFVSDPVTVTVFNDTTPPTVAITAPSSGATVTGTIAVSANASDNVGVVGVQFRLDGAPLGTEDTTNPYSVAWNSATASPGTHQLTAVARDAAGNVGTSAVITVTVADNSPPTVSITSPSSGATVTGTITVRANASDNLGVVGVQFRLDGAPLGTEDTTSPYSVAWNTTTASPGTHQLTAVARDTAGNAATSAVVTVTVPDHTPPTVSITSPSSGATVTGTIDVSANASDNAGVVGVQFHLDGAPLGTEDTTNPYSVAWNTTSAANGNHTLTALARDAAGNTTSATAVTVSVSNDTVPPTVAITAPRSGATVAGTIAVSASASDNVAVTGVQFRLNGLPLGAEDTTAPHSVQWDTQAGPDGTHTLTAVARDAAGNTTTSSSITVTVSNTGVGRGDIFVGLLDGRVQRHSPDGTLQGMLLSSSDGEASGLAFDTSGILYVPHWISKSGLAPGNLVERFDDNLNAMGTFGSGYNCNPSSFAFDAAGNVYVGQADCTGNILKLDAAGTPIAAYAAQTGVRGADHIDLASDGCTMIYSNWTKDVMRFNVCTNTQMPKFNTQPLPGETSYHLRILPDGGVLVADSQYIVRLDSLGNQIQTYFVLTEGNWWTGLDISPDGMSFWANNLATGNVFKFDLASGAVLSVFNAGPAWTVVGVAIKP